MNKRCNIIVFLIALIANALCAALLDRESILFGIVSLVFYYFMVTSLMRVFNIKATSNEVSFKNKVHETIYKVGTLVLGGIGVYFALFSKYEHRFIISFTFIVAMLLFVFSFIYYNKIRTKK